VERSSAIPIKASLAQVPSTVGEERKLLTRSKYQYTQANQAANLLQCFCPGTEPSELQLPAICQRSWGSAAKDTLLLAAVRRNAYCRSSRISNLQHLLDNSALHQEFSGRQGMSQVESRSSYKSQAADQHCMCSNHVPTIPHHLWLFLQHCFDFGRCSPRCLLQKRHSLK